MGSEIERLRERETGKLAEIRSFEDLDVWQKGKVLTLKIYEIASHFPKDEIYGMTSQVKRAALSYLPILRKDLGGSILWIKQSFISMREARFTN